MIAINPGAQWRFEGDGVITQTGNNITFNTGASGSSYNPTAGNPYYLYGSLAALTAPKETYYNGSTLYLYAPNGANPNGQNVEVRTRDLGLSIASGASYVTVSGIQLKAANVTVAGNHNLIDNCQILYPTSFGNPAATGSKPGVQITGQYNTLRHSEIAYSWGDGVTLTNTNNTVQNNVIHDVNWAGDCSGFVNTNSVSNNTITNNTMYNSGECGVNFEGSVSNTNIQYNDISRFGFLDKDLGGIYTVSGGAALTGNVVAYNRVHDSRSTGESAGIYLDNDFSGVTVHHNLVYNMPGTLGYGVIVNTPASNVNVYNNTLWNVAKAMSSYPGTSFTNVNTINNLSNGSDWVGNTISKNRTQTADQFTNSAAGDYTLTANSSGSNQGASYKRAVNYGAINAGRDGIVTADAGAFQSGSAAWTAGASWNAWTAGNQASAAAGGRLIRHAERNPGNHGIAHGGQYHQHVRQQPFLSPVRPVGDRLHNDPVGRAAHLREHAADQRRGERHVEPRHVRLDQLERVL